MAGIPTAKPEIADGDGSRDPVYASLAADVFWLGKVPDQRSALFIALDDPLAVLNDLGMQLASDRVAYQAWQQQHEHKSQMAQTVIALCGAALDPEKLPASVKNDATQRRHYSHELDAYFTQRYEEELSPEHTTASDTILRLPSSFKAPPMRQKLSDQYGSVPTEEDYSNWLSRWKWRKEIDLKAAHAYLIEHQPTGALLLRQVEETQADFEAWAAHIGTDPMRLFIDTGNPKTLLYLQMLVSQLLVVYAQDLRASAWLADEEREAKTLFGLARYGFSPGLKEALTEQADHIFSGVSDMTNLAGRVGELNGALNHEGFAEKPWVLALKHTVRDTFNALRQLAGGEGRSIAETILLAMLPADSRLASGERQNLGGLIRSLMISQLLTHSPDKIAIDQNIGQKLNQWKRQWLLLNKKINQAHNHWLHPDHHGPRNSTAKVLMGLKRQLELHSLDLPEILDFQNNRYAQQLRAEIKRFATSTVNGVKGWNAQAKALSQRWGINAGPITLGVVQINLLNTALTYLDITRDGEFSGKDMAKVSYNLGYTANLVMAMFVEAPWQIVKATVPELIDGKPVGILSRSAGYWKNRGNVAWGDAVHGFRRALVGMGGFGLLAAGLEGWELWVESRNANSDAEKKLGYLKLASVVMMGGGSLAQLVAGFTLLEGAAFFVMSPWFTVAVLIAGAIYLITSLALNYLKQDGVGWWLRKCCWSLSDEHRHGNTLEHQLEEKRSLLEIQMSPQILVKRTTRIREMYVHKIGMRPIPVQEGAWIQIRLPHELRGQLLHCNIASTKRPLGVLPVKKIDDFMPSYFLNDGYFVSATTFGKVSANKPLSMKYPRLFPAVPPSEEEVVWQVWVPLDEGASYIELQIWYPSQVLTSSKDDRGYLYQIELDDKAEVTADGLAAKQLSVKEDTREGAQILAVAR